MKQFSTTLMDPPWNERGGGKYKRGADRYYSLIKKKEDMLQVILQCQLWRPAEHAHLYLCVTNTFLPDGLWLMSALGFVYKTNLPWTKDGAPGIGQYFRGGHELILFGTRGRGYNVRTSPKNIHTCELVGEPRVKVAGKVVHSAKPPKLYDVIERRSLGPYCELFARNTRDGWESWGDELT